MKVKGFADTIDWYNNNARIYAETTYKVAPIMLIDIFVKMLPESPAILDAGCGPGRDSAILRKKRAEVYGIDISEGLLKIAREKNREINFVYGNFLALPFNDNSFDGVWAHAALVHLETIEDVKKSLQEFHRVLKNKGILHIYVKAQTGSEKTAVVTDVVSHHDRFFRYYTKEEMKGYIEKLGFKIRQLTIEEDGHGRNEVRWISIFAEK
jgi:ubiquinone/menaquinone biosynthesis C-methylase UbiE